MNSKLRSYMEVARANFLLTSILPVMVSLGVAIYSGEKISWVLLAVTSVGIMSAHSLTNLTNEYYDFKKGIDSGNDSDTAHPLASGKITENEVRILCLGTFILSFISLIVVFSVRGPAVLLIGLAGLLAGYYYTAPPIEYKYRAWGEIMILIFMGPLLGIGVFLSITGTINMEVIAASIPQGVIITAVLLSNNIRDLKKDTKAKIKTLPMRTGINKAYLIYSSLLFLSLISVLISVLAGILPIYSLAVLVTIPLVLSAIKKIYTKNVDIMKYIDLETLKIYISVDVILILSLLAGRYF